MNNGSSRITRYSMMTLDRTYLSTPFSSILLIRNTAQRTIINRLSGCIASLERTLSPPAKSYSTRFLIFGILLAQAFSVFDNDESHFTLIVMQCGYFFT